MPAVARSRSVLLVDDDDVDARLAKLSLKRHAPGAQVTVAYDGSEALLHLREQRLSTLPLIVLDLNMPGVSGHEVLRKIRQDEDLRKAVVFVFSTSSDERDIARCYEHNVAGYLVKGDSLDQLGEVLAPYLEHVQLPVDP